MPKYKIVRTFEQSNAMGVNETSNYTSIGEYSDMNTAIKVTERQFKANNPNARKIVTKVSLA